MFYQYKRLLKLFLTDSIRRRDKRQLAAIIIISAVYVLFAAIAVVVMVATGREIAADRAAISQVLTTILFADFLLTVFLGTVSAISFLFLSKDNEFFLGLPIKPQTIFLSKMTMVFLTEVIVSAAIVLPTFITLGAVTNQGFLFFALIPVAIIAVPVFSISIISLISFPIVFIASRLKNKGTLKTILVIIPFSVLMGGYIYLVMVLSSGGESGLNLAEFLSGAVFTSFVIYPLHMLTNLATLAPVFGLNTTNSALVSLSIFFISLIAFLFLSYFLAKFAYQKITRKTLESGTSKSSGKKDFVVAGAKKALIKKEWRMIVRNSTVALNTLTGVILGPLFTVIVVLIVANTMGAASVPIEGAEDAIIIVPRVFYWAMGVMMVFVLALGTTGATTCISREGSAFYFVKMLPISTKTQIVSKQIFYTLVSVVAVFMSMLSLSILLAVRGDFLFFPFILSFLAACFWAFAVTNVAIQSDLKNPKLDWRDMREVVKRIKSQVISLVWIGISTLFVTILIAIVMIFSDEGISQLLFNAFMSLFALFGLGAAILTHFLLHSAKDKYISQITV